MVVKTKCELGVKTSSNATVGAMIDRFTNTAQFIIYSRLRHDKQALIETASASVYEARSRRY